jgi:hypothetical protein
MSAAGYLESKDPDKKQDGSLSEIQLMSAGLSEAERQQVKQFIRFLQSQNDGPRSKAVSRAYFLRRRAPLVTTTCISRDGRS